MQPFVKVFSENRIQLSTVDRLRDYVPIKEGQRLSTVRGLTVSCGEGFVNNLSEQPVECVPS